MSRVPLPCAAVHRHEGLADPQRRARSIRPLPLGRLRQRLPRKVGAARPHLLARMRELQLDHPLAHRDWLIGSSVSTCRAKPTAFL